MKSDRSYQFKGMVFASEIIRLDEVERILNPFLPQLA